MMWVSDDVAAWMRSNLLQLNTSKTELLWCATYCTPVVKVSYRAPRFVLDLTWSILRQQFVTWVSTSMPIYPDAHRYWKQRRRVLLLCDSCWQYVGACRWPPTNHWSSHWWFVGWTKRQRDADRPSWLPVPSSAVRHKCGGKIDLQSAMVGTGVGRGEGV